MKTLTKRLNELQRLSSASLDEVLDALLMARSGLVLWKMDVSFIDDLIGPPAAAPLQDNDPTT